MCGCGLAIAVQAIAFMATTFGLLVVALAGLCATQLAMPALGAAKVLGVFTVAAGLANLAWAWSLAGLSMLLVVAVLPLDFGVLVLMSVRYMNCRRV